MVKRTCIICDEATGSAEHIFPAALGGRRRNKGIYCEKHNNGFSGLVANISEQFKIINALLGVRPDRQKTGREVNIDTKNGDSTLINKDGVHPTIPENLNRGETMEISMTLGGPEALPAIAYIALTFFAHYFPDQARQQGLMAIKSYVQNSIDNDCIWWENNNIQDHLPANPFPFGHTIAMAISNKTGRAYAVISLFQAFVFGIELGKVECTKDETVFAFLNPHAEHPPSDIKEIREEFCAFDVQKPSPIQENLRKMVLEDKKFPTLSILMEKIEKWRFSNEMQENLDKINLLVSTTEYDKLEKIIDIVELEQARIYRLIEHVINRFFEKHQKDEVSELIFNQYKTNHEGYLSPEGEAMMMTCILVLSSEIQNELSSTQIDMEYLFKLFSSGTGAAIVGKILFERIKNSVSAISP